MQGVANRTPILRNPAFASVSSRNPQTRSLAQSTFRGGFAQSGFARGGFAQSGFAGRRSGGQHRSFGSVLGFVGPLFWPYAYNDFVDYTFSPYAYDTFWPYAYDDLYQGIYGTYAPEYYANEEAYAYAGTPASVETYAYATGAPRQRGRRAASTAGATLICSGQAEGLTAFPIERIAQQVELEQAQQQALLEDLKAATANAVGILQAACPGELPSTPTGRISAMRARVEAMLQAVQSVRPALERFYQSLSDEQKERFTAVAQSNQSRQQPDLAGLCGGAAQRGGLPIDRVERELRLDQEQDAALQELNEASAKAADVMKANCQPDHTLTPTGRLAAIEERLTAMRHGLDQVQPALAKFYASLSDEQKARFNRFSARSG